VAITVWKRVQMQKMPASYNTILYGIVTCAQKLPLRPA